MLYYCPKTFFSFLLSASSLGFDFKSLFAGNALKGSPIDTLNRSCLLEERSGAASYRYDAPGASYSLKWIFHNDLGFKREYSQLEIEAKARAEELKNSNSNLVVVKGNRKNQVTWKGDGSEGKRNRTGGGGLKNDGDGKNGVKSENDRDRFAVAIGNNNNGSNLKSNGGDGKDNDNLNNGAFDVYRLQKKVRNK
ncbi:hypothetical protein RYX36_029919, partial [Vicia faba]